MKKNTRRNTNNNMKNVRIIITEKGLEVLKAFADESYLGNYIAVNENDLYYKNIFNFPDVITTLKEDIVLFAKDNISEEDEYVLVESISDMKRKNATYYSVILDLNHHTIKEFSNESGKLKLPFAELDTFEKLDKIQEIVDENIMEEYLEM